MLFADWLLLTGSWRQTMINWDDRAPATRPVARHLLCCRRGLRRLGRDHPALRPVRVLTGQASEADLVAVRESEELPAPSLRRVTQARMTIAVFTFSLLGAMALGMPIAFALIICGVALMSTIDMFDSQIVAQNVINGADSFPLMAMPVLHARRRDHEQGRAGASASSMSRSSLVGHFRGGLGYVTILGVPASWPRCRAPPSADAAALAALLVPMMVAAGHNKAYAAGLVAAGGIIAPVIPPSIGFVIFGVAANVSISKLFLAGIVPGPAARRRACASPGGGWSARRT